MAQPALPPAVRLDDLIGAIRTVHADELDQLTGAVDPNDGFNRFTTRARSAVMAAHNAAHDARNREVEPAHLVFGLVSDPDGLASQAIAATATELDDVRAAAVAAFPPAADDAPALVPYSEDARKVLEVTFREALRLGHDHVGTEHVLLALLETESDDGVLMSLDL